jgi:hypothetical protein
MDNIPLTSIEHNPSLGFTFVPQISTLFFLSKFFFSQNPFLRSLTLSLSTSLNICENECKYLISLKARVYIASTQMGSTLNCLNGKVFSN